MPEYSKGWSDERYVDFVDEYDFTGRDKKMYLSKLSFPSFGINENDILLMCEFFFQNIERSKDIGKEKNMEKGFCYTKYGKDNR